MKIRKWSALALAGVLAVAVVLTGCSSTTESSDESDYTLVTEGVLTVGTSPDYPPFENMEDGEYVGFDIDLATAVAEYLGLEVEFQTLNFDSILTAVASGGQIDIGVSGFSVDPERAETVDFTDAYYIDNLSVAVMSGSDITSDNAADALDSEDITIAVQSGTTGEDYALEYFANANVVPYTQGTECFAALQAGQADAVITNSSVVEQMIEQSYPDAEVVLSVATGEEYAIAVSKDNSGLTEAINEAIAALEEDGTIDELMEKWQV